MLLSVLTLLKCGAVWNRKSFIRLYWTARPWKFRTGDRSKLRKMFCQLLNFQNATFCFDTPKMWCNLESKVPRTSVFFPPLHPTRGVLTCQVCAGSRIICDCCKFLSVAVSWLEHVWYDVMVSIRAVSHCAQTVTRSVILLRVVREEQRRFFDDPVWLWPESS